MSETIPEPNPEIEAMRQIVVALQALEDDEARARVVRWAADRFGSTDDRT